EQLRLFFLDHRNYLIADEVLASGTINQLVVFPREIARRALDLEAVSVILVHNHPSTSLTPSKHDIDLTLELQETLARLDIKLYEHLIISKMGHYSFKAHQLL
ncbi:MAG: JAB domain-containing protein, partial [Pseudomonadota bacterium]